MSLTTKAVSLEQEKYIAKLLNGKVQRNSGGTKFGGGDVLTDKWFIEAKTVIKPKESFSIKKEWLEKQKEQAYEQNKQYNTLAFQFEPNGTNYFIVDEKTFKLAKELLENDYT